MLDRRHSTLVLVGLLMYLLIHSSRAGTVIVAARVSAGRVSIMLQKSIKLCSYV